MKYVYLFVLTLFLVACAPKSVEPTPPQTITVEIIEHSSFISSYIQEYSLSDSDLKKLQFYVSHDIVLYNTDNNTNFHPEIEDGVLILDTSSQSSQIIIKAGTACTFEKRIANSIYVHFDNDLELEFKTLGRECCTSNSKYYLAANNWKDNIGTIITSRTSYKALSSSGNSYLKIDKKSLHKNENDLQILKGKKVN